MKMKIKIKINEGVLHKLPNMQQQKQQISSELYCFFFFLRAFITAASQPMKWFSVNSFEKLFERGKLGARS